MPNALMSHSQWPVAKAAFIGLGTEKGSAFAKWVVENYLKQPLSINLKVERRAQ